MTKKINTKLHSSIVGTLLTLSIIAGSTSGAQNLQKGHDTTAISSHGDYLNILTGKIEYTLPGITSRNIWALTNKPITVSGKTLSERAVVMNGITYLPMRAVANALGNATVTYDKSTRTATLKMPGLYLTATDGGFVTYANDRPLFSFSPNVLMSNGKMYIPATALTKALGVNFTEEKNGSIAIKGSYRALTPASSYYREDEVYWLAKIINAESNGESLIGKIAVGDVIMNRVNSPLYPNTIYSVIFDRKYGVQFSPVLDGSIYATPGYTSILAAKICLEGTSLSDNALFFLNPVTAESSWIINNREYAYTIGGHDFYL